MLGVEEPPKATISLWGTVMEATDVGMEPLEVAMLVLGTDGELCSVTAGPRKETVSLLGADTETPEVGISLLGTAVAAMEVFVLLLVTDRETLEAAMLLLGPDVETPEVVMLLLGIHKETPEAALSLFCVNIETPEVAMLFSSLQVETLAVSTEPLEVAMSLLGTDMETSEVGMSLLLGGCVLSTDFFFSFIPAGRCCPLYVSGVTGLPSPLPSSALFFVSMLSLCILLHSDSWPSFSGALKGFCTGGRQEACADLLHLFSSFSGCKMINIDNSFHLQAFFPILFVGCIQYLYTNTKMAPE